MMTNLLIDTNIWIYASDKKSIFYPKAKAILSSPDYNFFITSKNISEFFAVTSKQKIFYESSSNYYEEIKNKASILFPNQNSLSIFEKLLLKYEPKGNQVYDIEIVSIMIDNNIIKIASFNRKDFINITEVQLLELP